MKLHLLLDSDIVPDVKDGDIVLISPYNRSLNLQGMVHHIDVTIANGSEVVAEEIRDLFSHLGHPFHAIMNTAYVRFFQPIEIVLMNVEREIRVSDISEIVLYEGGEEPCFISEGAEGEGERRGYKTNFMVNAYVKKQYEDKLKVSWVQKQAQWKTKLSCYWRCEKQILRLIASRSVKRLRDSQKIIIDESVKNAHIVSVISLLLQKRHLEPILNDSKDRHIYLSYNRLLVDNKLVYPILELPLVVLFKTWVNLCTGRFFCKHIFEYKCIKSRILIRELLYCLFKYTIYSERLNYTMSKLKDIPLHLMVSNTTVGDDMISIHDAASKMRMKHINIQYVSMDKALYPILDLADEYYLYSRKIYELYKQYSDCYRYYLPLRKEFESRVLPLKLTYTIFSQPDSFSRDYIDYLNCLCPVIKEMNLDVKVIVKPHYRQVDVEEYEKISREFDFLEIASPEDSVEELLKKTSIAMSIHSSVIFEAMMNGVPTIVYNANDKYHEDVYNEDYCYPEVNFVIEEPLQTMGILKNYTDYCIDFHNRLRRFVESSDAKVSIREILKG